MTKMETTIIPPNEYRKDFQVLISRVTKGELEEILIKLGFLDVKNEIILRRHDKNESEK